MIKIAHEVFENRVNEIESKLGELEAEKRKYELQVTGVSAELDKLNNEKNEITKFLNRDTEPIVEKQEWLNYDHLHHLKDKPGEVEQEEPKEVTEEKKQEPEPEEKKDTSFIPDLPIPEKKFKFKPTGKAIKPLTPEEFASVNLPQLVEEQKPEFFTPEQSPGQNPKLRTKVYEPPQPQQPVEQQPLSPMPPPPLLGTKQKTFVDKIKEWKWLIVVIIAAGLIYYFVIA